MSDSYVCSKAKIKCSCGDKISTLTVFPDRTIWLTGEPQANISDHVSMRNIAPFGRCHTTRYPATGSATAANHGHLTPMPCVPNTPFSWMNGKNDVLLKGQPALLKSSTCKCVWGGTISFTKDGQIEGTGKDVDKENPQTQEELDANAEVQLTAEELLDGLQMALDAAGMFPGLGAIPDLLNACISACRGDWVGAGLSLFAAIPGIGDAAGAAKLMKNGAKIAQKTKKAQKASSKVADIAEARAKKEVKAQNNVVDLAEVRAKKEAKAQQERLIEKGVADGKLVHFEKKQTVVVKKEATTGKTIEISQPSSVSRVHTTQASIESVRGRSNPGFEHGQGQGYTPNKQYSRQVPTPKSNESIFGDIELKGGEPKSEKVVSIEKMIKDKAAETAKLGPKPEFGL